MFHNVSRLLGLTFGPARPRDDELALATAALLVFVSRADGAFDARERGQLSACLQDHFSLSEDMATDLIARAEDAEQEATSLYAFVRTINRELDQDGRQEIVRLLWQVSFADNHLDNFELNALGKISALLGVSAHDRVRLKHEVEGR